MTHVKCYLFVWIMLAMMPNCLAMISSNTDDALDERISQILNDINSARTADAKWDAANKLFDVTHKAPDRVGDKTIAAIIGLLRGPDDPELYWVSRALGNFGRRASSAAPKLLLLLKTADCIEGSKTPASGIRFALKQMGVKPPPRPICQR